MKKISLGLFILLSIFLLGCSHNPETKPGTNSETVSVKFHNNYTSPLVSATFTIYACEADLYKHFSIYGNDSITIEHFKKGTYKITCVAASKVFIGDHTL